MITDISESIIPPSLEAEVTMMYKKYCDVANLVCYSRLNKAGGVVNNVLL